MTRTPRLCYAIGRVIYCRNVETVLGWSKGWKNVNSAIIATLLFWTVLDRGTDIDLIEVIPEKTNHKVYKLALSQHHSTCSNSFGRDII